jgi:hypothetical protein
MTTPETDRRTPLREALEPGPGCPPLAELLDTHFNGGSGARAEELRAHAESCATCSAELALAGAFDATPASAAEAQEIAWVAARIQLPTAAKEGAAPPLARVLPIAPHAAKHARLARSARGGAEMSLWNRWAAAALVVVGLGVAFEWAHRTIGSVPALPGGSGNLDPDVVRGGSILLESPVGRQTQRVTEFSWRPVPGATSYRIQIRDGAGEAVWQGLTPTARLATPPELAARLETYVTYAWSVTAFDGVESAVGHSPSVSFVIEPAP